MRGRVTRKHLAILSTLLFCISAMPTHAATITVTNTNDNGPGSLRQAPTIANDGDTIKFGVTGTITLTSGGLPINKNITISGPGADQLSIDANQAIVVFGVFYGKAATISGLTARNAQSGVLNDGTVTVTNCVLSGNSYDGLSNYGVAAVSSCVLTGNLYDGLYSYQGETTVSNSVVSGNSGGGLFNDVNFGPNNLVVGFGSMTVSDSIISDNLGPGIWNYSFLTILNSTLSGNSAGQALDGGGIRSGTFKAPGSVTVINSTISGNSAAICAGICAETVEIGNTILNANASGNIDGTVTSRGYNVCSDNGGGLLNGPGDQINTDPLLGPLQDNGGPTFTHLPLLGSPAIDAGDPNFVQPPFHDQRGPCFYRVFGRRIDVGSVETQPRPGV